MRFDELKEKYPCPKSKYSIEAITCALEKYYKVEYDRKTLYKREASIIIEALYYLFSSSTEKIALLNADDIVQLGLGGDKIIETNNALYLHIEEKNYNLFKKITEVIGEQSKRKEFYNIDGNKEASNSLFNFHIVGVFIYNENVTYYGIEVLFQFYNGYSHYGRNIENKTVYFIIEELWHKEEEIIRLDEPIKIDPSSIELKNVSEGISGFNGSTQNDDTTILVTPPQNENIFKAKRPKNWFEKQKNKLLLNVEKW